jgi:hypothetical protein
MTLDSLADAYQIVAELRTEDETRSYMATRKSDGAGVVIRVAQPPKGDAKNALTHFAADANLLVTLQHRNLIPVLDGRWVDTQTFAIVTERSTVPSLEELLARGEEMSSTRVAAILQEVNTLTRWARERGVVHRAIAPSTLFVEPGSDRVRASFVPRALPITGVPGPEADARTIASLAWVMLTREPVPSADKASLGDLRPDLPERLVEETKALLGADAAQESLPDVREYVAHIAMVDVLRTGEDESARIRTEIREEQRVALEGLEAERQDLARQRAENEKHVVTERAETLRTLERERQEMQQVVASAREEMRQALARATEEMEQKLERAREELEIALTRDRNELASIATVSAEAPATMSATEVSAQARSRPRLSLSKSSDSGYRWISGSQNKRRRVVLTTTAAFALLIAVSAVALGRHRASTTQPARKPIVTPIIRPAAAPLVVQPPVIGSVFDSAGGNVASTVTRTAAVPDSLASIDTTLTAPAPKPRPKRRPAVLAKPAFDSVAPRTDSLENPFILPPRDSLRRIAPPPASQRPPRDSARRHDSSSVTSRRVDSAAREVRRPAPNPNGGARDSAARDSKLSTPGPDASARDSAAREKLSPPRRPDSLSRDTTVKPPIDTAGGPPPP